MKSKMYYLLSFLIPMVVVILLYMAVGVIGGNKSILTVDLADQYVAFFNAFKNILDGKIGVFYSFSKTLGGNLFGLITYYLMSPFNLLIVFFDRLDIPKFVLLINILKISFCGLTGYIYFYKLAKESRIALLFSVVYALMAYNIVYSQNIMWLDGVILLPLIFLGIDRLIDDRPFMFYLMLTLSIICNYYIGYMSCIGSLLYFVYKSYLKDSKIDFKRICYFLKFLLLCVLTSSFVLVPSIFSLLQGKASGILGEFVPNQKFAIMDIVTRFFIGAFKSSDLEGGCPNVYVSLFSIVLVIYYFFNKRVFKKERFAALFFIAIFLVSFIFNPIDVVWHTFKHPYGFPFRYSFIFDFVLLIVACNSLLCIGEIDKNFIKKFILYSFILTVIVDKLFYTGVIYYKVLGTFLLMVGYLFYLIKRKSKTVSVLILLLVVGEMFLNSFLIVNNINYQKKDEYTSFVNVTGKIVDSLDDNSFYRLEKDYSYSTNDELLLNYSGISHFSSVYEEKNNEFLGKYLGIFNRFYITNYNGSTLVTNSLFDIKYLLSKRKLSYYSKINTVGDVNVYLNSYNLPLGFMVDKEILNLNLVAYSPFINQNNILKSMNSDIQDVFYKENYKVKLNNLELDGDCKGLVYKRINGYDKASLKIEIDVENTGILYGYLASSKSKTIDILLNGESIIDLDDQNNYRYNVLELGKYNSGDKVSLEVILLDDVLSLEDIMFYTLDLKSFSDAVNLLNNGSLISEVKSDYISFSVDVSGFNVLYTSIPYDDGFDVYVDGNKVEKNKCLDALMCVELDDGHHDVIFQYRTKGLILGIIFSIIGILGYIFIRGNFIKKFLINFWL